MKRKLSPQALTAAFLVLSAALSIAVLAVRNLFDDELVSLSLVTSHIRDILAITAEGDVHPPGMYLLAHLAWRIIPSFRWMNLAPIFVLYLGLAVFLFQIVPLFAHIRSQICLLLLATLHPQLLLWGTTFRWYSWWTGLALITLTLALQPRDPQPTLATPRALTLGLLLAALFYLNYITLLFAIALAAAMFVRYRTQPLPRALLTAAVFLTLIVPQLHTMIAVHLPAGHAQRYGLVPSTLRLLQSIATSEAYLPWHPLGLLSALVFIAMCIAGWLRLIKLPRSGILVTPQTQLRSSPMDSIVLFGLLFFCLVAASGLGGKPRNGLLLIPILAPAAALIFASIGEESRDETLAPRLQTAFLCFFALWSAVGIAHLLGRYGLTKSTMNDRPEEVVAFIEQAPSVCSVVVTYDSGLAYSLTQANLPRTLVISPYRGTGFDGARTLPAEGCTTSRLYAVHSYLNGSARTVGTFNKELGIAQQSIEGTPATNSFSPDPDAPLKRRFASLPILGLDAESAARLPDDRYIVTSGPIDRANLEELRRRMPHFISGYVFNPTATN